MAFYAGSLPGGKEPGKENCAVTEKRAKRDGPFGGPAAAHLFINSKVTHLPKPAAERAPGRAQHALLKRGCKEKIV